jgi:hypothetical protein
MVMPYHWGMAVGHVYTHATSNNIRQATTTDRDIASNLDINTSTENPDFRTDPPEHGVQDLDDQAEFTFENCEDDFLGEGTVSYDEQLDDEELLALCNVYSTTYN